ncbi:MAG: hypothetical protein GWP09_00780 [Nitrospiraceae bacterium]|nr:hypothetical protein [Nitrospiraceae bacterium]
MSLKKEIDICVHKAIIERYQMGLPVPKTPRVVIENGNRINIKESVMNYDIITLNLRAIAGLNYNHNSKDYSLKHEDELEGIIEKNDDEFCSNLSKTIRSELDIVSFLENKSVRNFYKKRVEFYKIINSDSDLAIMKQVSKLASEILNNLPYVPYEERALFFEHIPLGMWDDVYMKDIEDEVFSDFSRNHIRGNLRELIKKAICVASKKEVDLGHTKGIFGRDKLSYNKYISDYEFISKKIIEFFGEKYRYNREFFIQLQEYDVPEFFRNLIRSYGYHSD